MCDCVCGLLINNQISIERKFWNHGNTCRQGTGWAVTIESSVVQALLGCFHIRNCYYYGTDIHKHLQAHCRITSSGDRVWLGRTVGHIYVTFLDENMRGMGVPGILGQDRLIIPTSMGSGIGQGVVRLYRRRARFRANIEFMVVRYRWFGTGFLAVFWDNENQSPLLCIHN